MSARILPFIRRFSTSLLRLCWAGWILSAAAAHVPVPPSTPFLIDVWETEDGLPENSATCMVQTPDGYLWFGTFNGLARFDGVAFKVFRSTDTPGLPGPAVLALHLDRLGRLWAGGAGGLARLDPQGWRPMATRQGPSPRMVRNIVSDPAGRLAVTTFSGQIYLCEEESLALLPSAAPAKPAAAAYALDESGVLWGCGPEFYGRWTGTAWAPAPELPWASTRFILASPAPQGGFWVFHRAPWSDGRLCKMEQGRQTASRPVQGAIDEPWALREDAASQLWAPSTRSGLSLVPLDGQVRTLTTSDGLSYNALRFSFEDREGDVWLGTSGGGLMRLKPRFVFNYDTAQGLPNRLVKSVAEESPGVLLAGTHGGGVARLAPPAGATLVEIPGNRDAAYAWSVLRDRRGTLWIGTLGGGLLRLDPGPAPLKPAVIPYTCEIHALFEDSEGRIWVGGDNGLLRSQTNGFHVFGAREGFTAQSPRCVAQDRRAGVFWVATLDSGLLRYQDGRFTRVSLGGAPDRERVLTVFVDREGTLWAGTDGGLVRWRDGRLSLLGCAQDGTPRRFTAILEDDRDCLWLGSNLGILRCPKPSLNEAADTGAARFPAMILSESDGLRSVECSGAYQPSACRDHQGRLWFATMKGLAGIDPKAVRPNPIPPAVQIEAVLADGRPLFTRTMALSDPAAGQILAGAGTRRIEVQYTALSFPAPEKIQFRFRLEGLDAQWQEVGRRRSAYFTDLKPGNYRFRVTAANNDGAWNPAGAQLEWRVAPHLWQTLWFQALAGALLLAGLAALLWRLAGVQTRRRLTDREREKALSLTRARLADVLENTDDLVSYTDPEGRVMYLNDAGRRLVGLGSEATVSGVSWKKFHPPWARELVEREGFPRASQEGIWRGQTALLHHDGRELPVSQTILAHRSAEGALEFFSLVMHDLSALKQAEEALRLSEARYRTLVQNLGEALVEVNLQERITFANPAADQLAGSAPGKLVGRQIADFFRPDQLAVVRAKMAAVLRKETQLYEVEGFRDNGERVAMLVTATPWTDAAGEVLGSLSLCRDITERKRLEQHHQDSAKREAVARLAAGVAHDFNNLLTVIRGNVALVKEGGLSPLEQAEFVRQISISVERAGRLVRQLLTFGTRTPVQLRPLDLSDTVIHLEPVLRALIPLGVELDIRAEPGLPPVLANAKRLEDALTNLVVNAGEAMPRGGRITIRVTAPAAGEAAARQAPQARPGPFLRLTVADTGPGIAPELIPRLFEPYLTTKESGRAAGLGLAAVFTIIEEEHHGWIQVDSRPGGGAVFDLHLPCQSAPAPLRALPAPAPRVVAGGVTIFVVEDEPSVRLVVSTVLRRNGYRVQEAENGVDALTRWPAIREETRLLFTDLMMPGGINGRELAARLRQDKPDLKVVFTSGYSPELLDKDFQLEEGLNFLPKPHQPEELLNTLRACLEPAIPAAR